MKDLKTKSIEQLEELKVQIRKVLDDDIFGDDPQTLTDYRHVNEMIWMKRIDDEISFGDIDSGNKFADKIIEKFDQIEPNNISNIMRKSFGKLNLHLILLEEGTVTGTLRIKD